MENNPLADIDLDNIPDYLSKKAMEAKYKFNLEDETRVLGKGTNGKVHLFTNRNDRQ
jgi:hypothetical protein